MLAEIRDKALNSKRLGRDEGRWLLTEAPLLEVGALASEVRFARIPDKVVTFVIDSNPNYTNVCVTDCQFCAFYRKPGDRSEEHTSELQSHSDLVCRLLLEKKNVNV